MITSLRGILAAKSPGAAVVEVGGVGYRIAAPLTVTDKLPEVGAEVFLLTEFVVREDSQTLYGFLDERTRELFCRLTKVSGVGAKTALAMLGAMDTGELISALINGDSARLSSAPGIGAKTAERLIVEFRGSALSADSPGDEQGEAAQALAALGYKKAEIARALSALRKGGEEFDDVSAQVKAALVILARK